MAPTLRFLGATGTVTGSRFLVSGERTRVLVDCGLFQGLREHRRRNWEPFPVDPSSIDAVVLTHAHIDHCGYLPALVAQGFAGPVYCTRRTADLVRVLLPDAAHLQEEEARYANEKGFSKHTPALPLFTRDDADAACELLQPVPFGERRVISGEVAVTLHEAGHILGSAMVLLEVRADEAWRRVLFSGDLGRGDHPVLADPADPPAADIVIVESTYGDRAHPPAEPELAALETAIADSAGRGGMVLIPAFAVDRTEVVLMLLGPMMADGRIPTLPVYADSPMALRVLGIYRSAVEARDTDVRAEFHDVDFLPVGEVHECHTPDESRALAALTYPSIIISASGMATGGRVLHHLARLLPDPTTTVVLTGFQAAGTRGRALAEGADTVKMLGTHCRVRARVLALESLSVHADADDVLRWLGRLPTPPEVVYVVHGEPNASGVLASRVMRELDFTAVVPRPGERVTLSRLSAG